MAVTYGLRPDLSPQQKAVIDWVQGGSGSLNLIALAGTGKTSTLMEVAKVIQGTGYMGAFNKSIADEFSERLAAQRSFHVKGATLHSAGFAAWRKGRRPQIDASKVRSLARKEAPYDRNLANLIADMVGYGKQQCLGVEGVGGYRREKPWTDIMEYYDLWNDVPRGVKVEKLVERCWGVYEESLRLCETVIDFDDMLLAPLYHGAAFQTYDWVMIDEAQDTNTARRMIALAMMGPNSRMIAVGDPHQAIYRFAGADSDAMDRIKAVLGSAELPLSITYRCPRAVVDVAQEWVPDFTAAETAPDGLITAMKPKELLDAEFCNFNLKDDVILCRNTRPLVGIASVLRKQNVPCVVEGQSGKILKALAIKWGENILIEEWLEHLEVYRDKEVAKYKAKEDFGKVDYVVDKCGTARDLGVKVGEHKTVQDLVRHIEYVFGDNLREALHLCTIHKSKGREWKRVFLVGRNRYMPSPWAKKDAEFEQEGNLAYVAVTRAKHELVEVDVPFKDPDSNREWWERFRPTTTDSGREEVQGPRVEQEEPF